MFRHCFHQFGGARDQRYRIFPLEKLHFCVIFGKIERSNENAVFSATEKKLWDGMNDWTVNFWKEKIQHQQKEEKNITNLIIKKWDPAENWMNEWPWACPWENKIQADFLPALADKRNTIFGFQWMTDVDTPGTKYGLYSDLEFL